MAMSRRSLRSIVVDDVRYYWKVRVDPARGYLRITVQGNQRSGQVLRLVASTLLEGVDLPLPRRVRRLIENGLAAGWRPNEPGATMLFTNVRPRPNAPPRD